MSSNQRFQKILDCFNSEDDDNGKTSKNKKENLDNNNQNKNKEYTLKKKNSNIKKDSNQIESQIKYDNNIPRNSNDENILENIKINYFDNIATNTENENNELNGNNKNIDKNIEKDSLNKNNNDNNLNLQVKEISLLDSFRPKQEPNSPEFIKKESDFNYINNGIPQQNKNNFNNYNNNAIYISNNNFSETIQTKIIGNNLNKKNQKQENNLITLEDKINGNKSISNHDNNIVSLGKEIVDNFSKTSEELEKQKEEEFLMKEDFIIKTYKGQIKEEEENGKENVIDDDDEDIQNHKEINQPKFSRNIQNNIYNSETQTTMNNRIKDMSKKLFHQKENNNNDNSYNDNNNINNQNANNNAINNYTMVKEEEKYETNSAKKNIINKIYNKNSVIKKTGIKYNNIHSPSEKNLFINMNNNNSYYNSEYKDSSINSFNIISNREGVYFKKNVNKNDLKNIKKQLIYSNKNRKKEEKKIPIKKKEITSITPIKNRKLEAKQEKYTFTPLINKKSKRIWERRNKKLEENDINSNSNSNKKSKTPIHYLLNEIGIKQKEKQRQNFLTEKNNIILNANIKKINENCYDMAKNYMNKKIDKIIMKYAKDDELSFVNIVQCLCIMRIINELIKVEQINDLDINMIKAAVNKNLVNDKKKLEEREFIEQLWFMINPTSKEYINSKLFSEIIKKLFMCDNSKIKSCSEEIKDELKKYQNENKKEDIYYGISPIREKTYEKNEIWSIQKLIKSFLKLKSDLKAYKNKYYELKIEDIRNDLNESREKELKFEPDLSKSNKYVFKNPKYKDYNTRKDDLNKTATNISVSKRNNFTKIYERMMEEKKTQENILKKMREIKDQKELKKCTLRPQILKYKLKRMNKSVDITASRFNKEKKLPKTRRDGSKDNKNKFNSKRSFNEINNKNISKSKSKNKNTIVVDKKINNFAIKNRGTSNNNKNKNNVQITYQKKKIKNNKIIKSNTSNSIIDNIYVTIEIKTPNGDKKPIKIFKNQHNINEEVEKFCKENKITNENKDIIYNNALFYSEYLFGRNTYKNNFLKYNLDENFSTEYRETNTYTNNNNN